ncbi:MAG TPA: thiolase family protein [Acidimicrobiales bacterium]|jgi:acetyl-CoA acetyltransferase|nr:thiolase family protein [Acidimicrobiales bacterium]
MPHPFRDVAIVGVFNTEQARQLEGHDSQSIALEGALGALADAGIGIGEVDGIAGQFAADMVLGARMGPCSRKLSTHGIPTVLEAASMIAFGECEVVLIAAGGAAMYTERAATAPWTRPSNELVAGYGLFTAAEFALMARRHMLTYGTTPAQLAAVAATIRNNGHVNPEAVYCGRGPFEVGDILASRMVADPFHLLECAMTSEGGCGLVLTTAERADDAAAKAVWILGGAGDTYGPAYVVPPVWDLRGRDDGIPAGYVGRRAAQKCFALGGLGPDDVDVAELYDPFSFEIIRQLEAFGFCGEGDGGAFVEDGHIAPGGRLPVTTDGGTMSFSHAGLNVQMLQRVIRGVQQLRGTCVTGQVAGAEVALCSNGGSGALFNDVMLLGSARP